METLTYHAWGRCACLRSGSASLYITLDFGPRIIGLEAGGENLLGEIAPTPDLSVFQLYGGHRLWIAPEDSVVSYEPDNTAVSVAPDGDWIHCTSALGESLLEKTLSARPSDNGGFEIRHMITNRSTISKNVSAWGLTVMRTGGECLIPQPPHAQHPEALLPARRIVLWPYTDMSDDRWTWGKRVIRLRQDTSRGPQKLGALLTEGIATYAVDGQVFVKRFEFREEEIYPDMGCNFETFTREDMLEVESLGPLTHLGPGESTQTHETWYVLSDEVPPQEDEAAGDWLLELAIRCPHANSP